ncbi:MAG: M24 family metallopeptidase [Bacillota bacterium]|jgi:Xaa-Pro aminopeptidase
MAPVPAEYLPIRLENLRNSMRAKGLDAVLINHPANRHYIGGVYANDTQIGESAGWLLIGLTKAYGLFSSAHFDEWKSQATHLENICLEPPSGRKYPVRAAEIINANQWKRIGVDEDALGMRWHDETMAGLGGLAKLLPMGGLIEELRNEKDEWELSCVREACAITSKAYEYVMSYVKPGITEKELAWELEKAMRENGADDIGFDTIVGAGEFAAVPHHVPIDRKIAEGESVVVDMGAMVNGYGADMTRTFCFGKAPERLVQMHSDIEKALDREVSYAVVGAKPNGHGVGLSIHENLRIREGATLRPNMTLAIEPAVYVPGWGGVRLEDTVLVTADGQERLTTATMQLEFV